MQLRKNYGTPLSKWLLSKSLQMSSKTLVNQASWTNFGKIFKIKMRLSKTTQLRLMLSLEKLTFKVKTTLTQASQFLNGVLTLRQVISSKQQEMPQRIAKE